MQAIIFEAFNSSDADLDDFEFNLEGNDDLMLADSKTSNATMDDFQFESMKEELTSSMNDLNFDDLSDDEDAEPATIRRQPPNNARASRSRRSLLSKSKNFQMDAIDFDPPAAGDRTHDLSQSTNQVSNGLPSSASLSSLGQQSVFTVDSYNEALEHLAQTMKRTEESRRRVMLHRAMMTHEMEQRRLQSEELAAMHASQAMEFTRMRSQVPHNVGANQGSSLSGAAAFLSGSSGRLAQSRRQLQMYMAQMNVQTF